MGYCTIRLDHDISRVYTIMFFGVKTATKGYLLIAGSPDIFQSNMAKQMVALEFVKMYLDNLVIIPRQAWKTISKS